MLKTSLFLTAVLLIFFTACGQKKTSAPPTTSKVENVNLSEKDENLVKTKIPLLTELLKSKGTSYDSLLIYATYCFKTDLINSEPSLLALFNKRGRIEQFIDSVCADHFLGLVEAMNQNNDKKFEAYEKELALIGIRPVFAEGQYAGLSDCVFLESVVQKVASEPFQWYIHLNDASASSLGGEYPFMDLSQEMISLEWGEKLLQKYPTDKYTQLAENTFYQSLNSLTDVHKVINEDMVQCVIGEASTDFYPMGTELENYTNFIQKYPNSRFKKVVEKIVTSMSEVEPEKQIYAVVIDEFSDIQKAQKQVNEYLLQGIDIPHVLTIGQEKYASVYRFYADEKKAQQALNTIKPVKPNAKILKL